MTASEALKLLEESGKTMLTPSDVAPVLGCAPYNINVQARVDPAQLGFPVCKIGSRVKIPRTAFLNWYYGKETATP